MSGADPVVSVIIPTHHRPELLRRAVESVLRQELGEDTFEVIVGVSDAASAEDRAVAEELAAADSRVFVAVASRPGAGAARNVAMRAARGVVLAFTDDDCCARPGWLRAGLDRLREVDLVQGRTGPAEPVDGRRHPYSIWVDGLSWRWETCNLLVRRAAADRAGGFEEDWIPQARRGLAWGEDIRWGWRVVRAGATYAFEPDAVVDHAVFERTLTQRLGYRLRARFLPLILRDYPEAGRAMYRGWFIDRDQARMAASAALLGTAALSRVLGARMASRLLLALGLAPLLLRMRRNALTTVEDGVTFAAAAYGSIRYRRLLL